MTSAFGELRFIRYSSHFCGFLQVNKMRNATKTSRDYADILRTPADVLGGLALIVGMMVAVDALQRLQRWSRGSRTPAKDRCPLCISQVAAVCFRVCGETPSMPARLQAAAKPFLMSPMRSPLTCRT